MSIEELTKTIVTYLEMSLSEYPFYRVERISDNITFIKKIEGNRDYTKFSLLMYKVPDSAFNFLEIEVFATANELFQWNSYAIGIPLVWYPITEKDAEYAVYKIMEIIDFYS